MITFAFEKLADVLKEPGVRDLVEKHYYEIAEDQDELPLSMNWAPFLRAEAAGQVMLRTARDNGLLVGYQMFEVREDLSTRTLGAWDWPYYLDSEYRRGMNGYTLCFGADGELRARGVRRIVRHQKWAQYETRGSAIYRRAGYRPFEVRWTKVLP